MFMYLSLENGNIWKKLDTNFLYKYFFLQILLRYVRMDLPILVICLAAIALVSISGE